MELLTAVNNILPKLGEHPVTSISIKHPTLAVILPIIDTTLDDITRRGWWFNSFDTTLYPDTEKNIALPSDTLSFVSCEGRAIQRGLKLYDGENLTYEWDAAIKGNIITRVPFEELPESAASLVWYTSLVTAYVSDIGTEQDLQMWMQQAGSASAAMMSEHLRVMKYSTQRSVRYARLRKAMRA